MATKDIKKNGGFGGFLLCSSQASLSSGQNYTKRQVISYFAIFSYVLIFGNGLKDITSLSQPFFMPDNNYVPNLAINPRIKKKYLLV